MIWKSRNWGSSFPPPLPIIPRNFPSIIRNVRVFTRIFLSSQLPILFGSRFSLRICRPCELGIFPLHTNYYLLCKTSIKFLMWQWKKDCILIPCHVHLLIIPDMSPSHNNVRHMIYHFSLIRSISCQTMYSKSLRFSLSPS